MRQRTLDLGGDPVATFASYLGPGQLVLEDAARDFLCFGRVCYVQTDVPEAVLLEAAAAIWTAGELAELRRLQAARAAITLPDDAALWEAHERAWLDAWKAEMLFCARLIRRVSPRWAGYWEGGWR